MADPDVCEQIEEWAREALGTAGVELPKGASVSASAGDGGSAESDSEDERSTHGYVLHVELPEGEGQQQLAHTLQSTLTQAVSDDPTLGGRFEEVKAAPAGVELVEIGDAGVRTAIGLTSYVTEEPEEDESRDDADEDSGDADDQSRDEDSGDDDDSGQDEPGDSESDADDDQSRDASDDDESRDDDSDSDSKSRNDDSG
jgi:hypothetical protein